MSLRRIRIGIDTGELVTTRASSTPADQETICYTGVYGQDRDGNDYLMREVLAGEVIRIRTTGGRGWGDPLIRPHDEVRRDLSWGKISFAEPGPTTGSWPAARRSAS